MSKKFQKLLSKAEKLYQQEKWDECISVLTECIPLAKDADEKSKIYYNRGANYGRKGEHDRALEDYSKAIELKPDYADAYHDRGVTYGRKGEYDRALENFSKAIELKPDDADAYHNRGVAYNKKGEHDRALEDFSKAIELKPDYAEAYNNRGLSYNRKGEYDRALEDHNKAIELKLDYAGAYNNRGIIYGTKDEYDRALEDFSKAIELDSDYAEAYHNRGLAYFSKSDYGRAIEGYDKAIELKTDYADAYHNRGFAYFRKGDYGRAIEDYDKAIELKPDYTDTYYNRGLAYFYKGDYNRTIEDYDKAIQLKPDHTKAYYNRGVVFLIQKKYELALASFLESDKHNSSLKFQYVYNYIAFHLKDIENGRSELFRIFCDLLSAIETIQAHLFRKPKETREVAHYTALHTLKNLVREKGCFRLYNAAYMNDPEEGDVFFQIMEKHSVDFKDDFYPDISSYIPPAYIGSFVTVDSKENQKDKLFLWRTYGKHDGKEAGGACLVFKHDGDCFAESLPSLTIGAMPQSGDMASRKIPDKPPLYEIAYKSEIDNTEGLKDELNKLEDLLQEIKDNFPSDQSSKDKVLQLVRAMLDEIRFLFKADHYKEEKEFRVVRVRYPGEENQQQGPDEIKIDIEQIPPRFYLETDKDFRFNEVILGPSAQRSDEWTEWLKRQRKGLAVEKSEIKYRNS